MGFISSLLRRAEKRRAYAELSRLDDHLLRDIGLSRSDLHSMAGGARTAHHKGNRRD
ncbi:MAG: DUF1127 domain-containing protein [Hyphomicrobiales bacterium]|nr:MAG: DUF1127 domain-containing protein [Hyphomicrobiales bacterium]